MKRIICLLLCLTLLSGLFALPASAAPQTDTDFSIDAEAALLIDLNTGEALYELNADDIRYPASLTKIMTAILAIERGNLEDVVTASKTALENMDPDGTTVWLTAGEQMPLKDLLYCMLLASANDACNVVAEYIAGSVDDFVDLMNAKAQELGCTKTHFANTNGLPDDNHTTTARDLAIITEYAIQNPTFWEICTTTAYTVPATNAFDARQIATTNAMTTTYKYYYYYDSRIQGVKTGYTSAAGRCLIVTASDAGHRLLSVVLGAPDTLIYNNVSWYGHYADTAMLLEYGFERLEEAETAPPEEPEESEPIEEAVPPEETAPAETETEIPTETVFESPAEPEKELPTSEEPVTQSTLTDIETTSLDPAEASETEAPETDPPEKKGHFPWLLTILIVFAILIEACVVYVLYYRHQYHRRRVQRESEQQRVNTK